MKSDVSTTKKSIEIVFALQELEGASIDELADCLKFPKSTVYRHLSTLEKHNFISKNGREYEIGLQFLQLGEYARTKKKAHRLAKASVTQLAESTGERSQFVVEEGGEGVYIHIVTSEHAVRTGLQVGERIPLHSTAAGKVILAHLSEQRISQILSGEEFSARTDETITNLKKLREQLIEVKERGCAFNRGENIKGLRAVAAPVTDTEDELIGVLSVSGPSNRMKGATFESEIPDLVMGSANELSLRIKYD